MSLVISREVSIFFNFLSVTFFYDIDLELDSLCLWALLLRLVEDPWIVLIRPVDLLTPFFYPGAYSSLLDVFMNELLRETYG